MQSWYFQSQSCSVEALVLNPGYPSNLWWIYSSTFLYSSAALSVWLVSGQLSHLYWASLPQNHSHAAYINTPIKTRSLHNHRGSFMLVLLAKAGLQLQLTTNTCKGVTWCPLGQQFHNLEMHAVMVIPSQRLQLTLRLLMLCIQGNYMVWSNNSSELVPSIKAFPICIDFRVEKGSILMIAGGLNPVHSTKAAFKIATGQ